MQFFARLFGRTRPGESPPPAPGIYLTVHGQGDGLGSQIQSKASGIAFARRHGYTHVYTPLRKVDHIRRRTARRMDRFFNLGATELHRRALDGIEPVIVDPSSVAEAITAEIGRAGGEPVLIQTLFLHVMIERESPSLTYTDEIRDLLRARYHATPKPRLRRSPDEYHVALHLRRGDVNKEEHPNRWVESSAYRHVMERIRAAAPRPPRFHVYSEGRPADFPELAGPDVTFHLNRPLGPTLHGMITADELVMGKSSFGYIAGLYSRGVVHYFPFWHRPLDDWVIEKLDGSGVDETFSLADHRGMGS